MIYNLSRIKKKKPSTWAVEPISGASYGFELNSNGYYESKNKGIDNSYAICRVQIHLVKKSNIIFTCINYAEDNYDFGILGRPDQALLLSSEVDSSGVYEKSFKGLSQSSPQTYTYYSGPAGDFFIDVKYRKDSSQSKNNDSFQFKVEIQEMV